MPTYNLIITDVTRYGTLFCVAGWDLNNGGMIRPEPQTANALAEASRFWSEQSAGAGKFFAVGNIVHFDAIAAPEKISRIHTQRRIAFIPAETMLPFSDR